MREIKKLYLKEIYIKESTNGILEQQKENNVTTFSKQVQKKLMSVGGSATIQLLNGDVCHILLDKDNTGFVCDKLNNYSLFYHFEVYL